MNALKCYTCNAVSSDCESNSLTCHAGLDRCGKVTYEAGGKKVVAKSCFVESTCENFKAYCDILKKASPTLVECKGTCCSGDNCNLSSKNSQVMISIIVFGVLAAIMLK